MATRSEARALAAIQKMELDLAQRSLRLGEDGVGVVKFLKLDLGSPVSAREAAIGLLAMEDRLDILGEWSWDPYVFRLLLMGGVLAVNNAAR